MRAAGLRANVLFGMLCGLAAGSLIPLLAAASTKRVLLAVLGLMAALVVIVAPNRERWCLAGMILLMPVNINYFLFERYAPHIGGAPGLYLVACDLPLLLLYGLWFFEATVPKMRGLGRSGYYASLYLPFLLIGGLSILYAANPAWASYDFVRWIRVGLIVFYAAKRVKLEDVKFCFYALAGSVLVQGGIAALQTMFRTNFGMDKLGIAGRGSENVFAQEVGTLGSIVRGAGTMGHPNILGPYLVMIVPIFLLLAIVDTHAFRRRFWAASSAVGVIGLACTLSRASWVSFAVGAAAVAVALLWFRLMDPRRVVTLVFAVAIVSMLALAPFLPLIVQRFQTDYSESIRFRSELNQVALRIIRDHPLTGVGLNNFTIVSPRYIPDDKDYLKSLEELVPAVHNLYLLVAAELGILGLAAFLLFWAGSFARALRHPWRLGPLARATIAGVACGFVGMLFGDLAGFALWTDANMWTGALLIGLFEPLESMRVAG